MTRVYLPSSASAKSSRLFKIPNQPLLLKNPFDAANFLYTLEKFPQARYVFLYRHPAEIVNSTLRLLRPMFETRDEYAALMLPRYDSLSQNSLKLAAVRHVYSDTFPLLFRQACHYVSRCCGYMADNRDKLGTATIGVTYSELCTSPDEVVQRILTFLGLTEKFPLDYTSLIQRREPALLPEVQRNLAWIEQQNASYMRAVGIPTKLNR